MPRPKPSIAKVVLYMHLPEDAAKMLDRMRGKLPKSRFVTEMIRAAYAGKGNGKK